MTAVDPLTPFTHWRWDAPYEVQVGKGFRFAAKVVPVQCKSGLAVAAQIGLVHLVDRAAAIIDRSGDSIRYGARWMCSQHGSGNAVLLAGPEHAKGSLCGRCGDARLGACVYRCTDAAGRLLYIGSTDSLHHRRTAHASRSAWWPEVADVRVQCYPALPEARIAEWDAIRVERPIHNKRSKAAA